MTQIDRINELSRLLLQMCQEYDMNKFFELQRKFDDILTLNSLEDEINAN
jgi:hypothetical protein